jgi:diguanylate cyclase (GGDEF)-like protein
MIQADIAPRTALARCRAGAAPARSPPPAAAALRRGTLPADPGGRRRRLAIAMAVAVGVLGSVLLAAMFVSTDARTQRAAFAERAGDYRRDIGQALEHAAAAVSVVQGFMAAANHPVGRAEFARFAASVREALPFDLRETAWAPRVTDADRAGFEQALRAEGFADFQISDRDDARRLIPAADRALYFPVQFVDPDAALGGILGFDFISEPRRLAALRRARATGRPAALSPLRLNLSHPNDGSAFIIVAPVLAAPMVGAEPGLAGLRGAVLGILAAGPLVERALAGKARAEDLDVAVFDPAAPPGDRLIYWHPSAARTAPAAPPSEARLRGRLHLEARLPVADLEWGLLIARPPAASPGLLAAAFGRIGGRAVAALLVGLALTAGMAAYLAASLRHALRLEALANRLQHTAADLARTGAEVAHLACHDPLTGLPNRSAFHDRLRHALEAHGQGLPCVLCLDLDRFKTINDTFGHPAGDALLGLVAARLRACLRPEDIAARMGGDEFAVLLQQHDPPAAEALARRLIEVVGAPYEIRGNRMAVGVSIGIAFPAGGPGDADILMRNADLALYRAKQDGRGTWCFFAGEMETAAQARRTMEAALREAVTEMAFELHFQPVIRLHDRRICGFEALLRWTCPGVGRVSPAEFVPLAEECGLIVPIGRWVLQTACAAAAFWPAEVRVAVNLSAAQFASPTLLSVVADALSASGLAPSRLELEITETVMLQDSSETLATLHALKALGVSISMDDFGTGYSSLSYLCKFPFDTLKIDQSFVREMPLREDCRSVVRAVIGLCRNLGIATIAEGVETDQHLHDVVAEHCDEAQGYLFSRPLPLALVPALLAGWSGEAAA